MRNIFNIITFCAVLRGISGDWTNIQTPSDNELIWSKDQCDSYCFGVAKPLLNHFTQWKAQIDAHDEMKEKINKLEKELENSKIQIKAKDDLLNEKDELIKELRTQLSKEESNHQLKEKEENLPDTCPNSPSNEIQRIQIDGLEPFEVSCMAPQSGWTLIQRRFNGSVNFDRDWEDYKNGFGDIRGEFFIGMKKLHLLTQTKPHELYIQMRDVNGTTKYARYNNFNVGSESDKFKLNSVGKYSGTAEDSLGKHVGDFFSTRDQDNDSHHKNCAAGRGGWWYNKCGYSHLNGQYHADGYAQDKLGIAWGSWNQYDYSISLTFVQIMIRPTLQIN